MCFDYEINDNNSEDDRNYNKEVNDIKNLNDNGNVSNNRLKQYMNMSSLNKNKLDYIKLVF